MKIVVIGGSGLIGSKLVSKLKAKGHDVLSASPASGVNTITGEGLMEALIGYDVVVDVANSPSFGDSEVMDFFQTSGRNILDAEEKAQIAHHVALSIVGTERLQESGYFRAKMEQERLVRESRIPYTIVHSTQFFEFLGSIAGQDDVVRLSPAFIQPISSEDVAEMMSEIVEKSPVRGIVEIAGPEKFQLCTLVQDYIDKKQENRKVVADTSAQYFGATLYENTLIPGDNATLGSISFEKWFASQY